MKYKTSKEIRQTWIDFWKSKDHQEIASKSLIPHNDPSLLWINSGVATLKDYFSGKKIPQNPRIVNAQKAIRTNDIENVGLTARHHTLFEMLGNFSIGDYFKEQALEWAYEFIFDVLGFEKEKIYITYYEEDQATYQKWIDLGINQDYLIKGNKEMNFWDVGSGPCGPDTEIFYDRGKKYDPENIGLKLLKDDLENDRYVEIWNIVFSEFNNDGNNNYVPLAQKNIDTGAGLERIVSIFQDAPTNFDTDLFLPIIKEIEKMTKSKYDKNNYFIKEKNQTRINKNFRIIADHIRAVTLAIQDGAKPSNTQRGYIIRRLIRRAYRSGIMLGIKDETFLFKLVPVVKKAFGVYEVDQNKVTNIIKQEEELFAKTITQGEEILTKELKNVKEELDFKIAFNLFETYGFPVELTQEILEEKGIKLDISQFDEYKEKHAEVSRSKATLAMQSQIQVIQKVKELRTKFIGYTQLESDANVLFCQQENSKYYVLLDQTPFYPTGGGQAADKGTLEGYGVEDVFKDKYGNIWHILDQKISGKISAQVDQTIRKDKERNHSATHLLNFALKKIFGESIVQLGSDNNENRLRFDFPLDKRPTEKELLEVENLVNELIDNSIARKYIETTANEAVKMGAIKLENEDYGNEVRVVKFNEAIEFCGGTHIENTKEIEQFKIVKFEKKGAGVFRIEGITSLNKINKFNQNIISDLSEKLNVIIKKNQTFNKNYKVNFENIAKPIKQSFEQVKKLEDSIKGTFERASSTIERIKQAIEKAKKDNKYLNKKSSNTNLSTDVKFREYDGMKAYINLNLESNILKNYAINLREAHPDALFIIGSRNNNKTTLAIASKKYNSKAIFDKLANQFNGRGGGNENFAMGSMDKIEI